MEKNKEKMPEYPEVERAIRTWKKFKQQREAKRTANKHWAVATKKPDD